MLRTFALQQLLLATNLRLPASLDSALTPSLASWPPASASAQKPHDSDLDPLLHGSFQRHLAASSIKNSDWHSKPWEIQPFNPPGCPPPHPAPASTPHPSTPHFSPSLQCFSSIFLQPILLGVTKITTSLIPSETSQIEEVPGGSEQTHLLVCPLLGPLAVSSLHERDWGHALPCPLLYRLSTAHFLSI